MQCYANLHVTIPKHRTAVPITDVRHKKALSLHTLTKRGASYMVWIIIADSPSVKYDSLLKVPWLCFYFIFYKARNTTHAATKDIR